MVGHAASSLIEIIHAVCDCLFQVIKGFEADTAYCFQLFDIIGEDGSFHINGFVRTPCRKNLNVERVICLDFLMPFQSVHRVIRRADQGNARLFDQAADTHLWCFEFLITELPYFFRGFAA